MVHLHQNSPLPTYSRFFSPSVQKARELSLAPTFQSINPPPPRFRPGLRMTFELFFFFPRFCAFPFLTLPPRSVAPTVMDLPTFFRLFSSFCPPLNAVTHPFFFPSAALFFLREPLHRPARLPFINECGLPYSSTSRRDAKLTLRQVFSILSPDVGNSEFVYSQPPSA